MESYFPSYAEASFSSVWVPGRDGILDPLPLEAQVQLPRLIRIALDGILDSAETRRLEDAISRVGADSAEGQVFQRRLDSIRRDAYSLAVRAVHQKYAEQRTPFPWSSAPYQHQSADTFGNRFEDHHEDEVGFRRAGSNTHEPERDNLVQQSWAGYDGSDTDMTLYEETDNVDTGQYSTNSWDEPADPTLFAGGSPSPSISQTGEVHDYFRQDDTVLERAYNPMYDDHIPGVLDDVSDTESDYSMQPDDEVDYGSETDSLSSGEDSDDESDQDSDTDLREGLRRSFNLEYYGNEEGDVNGAVANEDRPNVPRYNDNYGDDDDSDSESVVSDSSYSSYNSHPYPASSSSLSPRPSLTPTGPETCYVPEIETWLQTNPLSRGPAPVVRCVMCSEELWVHSSLPIPFPETGRERENGLQLGCGHIVGASCFLKWINTKLSNADRVGCPVCRAEITAKGVLDCRNILLRNNGYALVPSDAMVQRAYPEARDLWRERLAVVGYPDSYGVHYGCGCSDCYDERVHHPTYQLQACD